MYHDERIIITLPSSPSPPAASASPAPPPAAPAPAHDGHQRAVLLVAVAHVAMSFFPPPPRIRLAHLVRRDALRFVDALVQ
jgi:hypothetical protein